MTQSRNILLERPLSARSVMASLLLGMQPPRIRGALLVRWCSLFGVSEGTARVALHRMTARGELVARGGVYELAGRLAERQREQEESLDAHLGAWDGHWALAAITSESRDASERQALRRAMAATHFAELREGVWTRPSNLRIDPAPVVTRQCTMWQATPDDDPRDLAEVLFAPRRWAERAEQLRDGLHVVTESLGAGAEGLEPDGFVAGAAALRHVRADPLLPAELLPARWPGDGLRAAYREYRLAFGSAAEAWFRREAS